MTRFTVVAGASGDGAGERAGAAAAALPVDSVTPVVAALTARLGIDGVAA